MHERYYRNSRVAIAQLSPPPPPNTATARSYDCRRPTIALKVVDRGPNLPLHVRRLGPGERERVINPRSGWIQQNEPRDRQTL